MKIDDTTGKCDAKGCPTCDPEEHEITVSSQRAATLAAVPAQTPIHVHEIGGGPWTVKAVTHHGDSATLRVARYVPAGGAQ